MPSLSICMAVWDDYNGLYGCLQGLRSQEGAAGVQFVVVDNYGCAATKHLCQYWGAAKYVLAKEKTGTAYPRNRAIAECDGDFVLCVDSHIGLMPGALPRFREFLEVYPDTDDLLQGVLLFDNLKDYATHFDPVWGRGMWGRWAKDRRGEDPDAAPFVIGMQGLGLFAVRRASWAKFSPHFQGFGGEEGYIHGKYQQRGNRTLCLPFLRWYHRFQPENVPTKYPSTHEDRLLNYFTGWMELGWDVHPVADHFITLGVPGSVIERTYVLAKKRVEGS